MKLYSICTPEASYLRDQWFLKTLQDDWELHIVDLQDAPRGSGDYLSQEWYHCISRKIPVLLDAISASPDEIIIWADMDIQFFRPCTDIVTECMQDRDIVFQRWRKAGADVNSGFMAIRCNATSRAFLADVAAAPFEGRPYADQDVINDRLRTQGLPLRWGLFPREVYQVMLGLIPSSIALHHACATPPPCLRNGKKITSMDHKAAQLALVRRYTQNPWWGKLLFRLKELAKRSARRI